jgi:alkaline phosphatase
VNLNLNEMIIKRSIKLIALLALIVFSGFTWDGNSTYRKSREVPKNIILFIGDGMGLSQIYAAMTRSDHPLFIEKFPYTGFSRTYSADNYITDSAAGGTALACGVKTNNGMIGMKPDGSVVSSIIEIAHKHGLATGVVSTSAVTHATPASFVAHNAGRGNYEDIAKDFLKGTVDLFLGGGENHFRARKDSLDLTVALKNQGFDVVYNLDDMNKSTSLKLAALLAKEHMPTVAAGRKDALAEMTAKAVETLGRNDKGFVLMVEGSMIDWGGHEQNIDYVVSETIDFDKAVGVGLNYAEQKGNTLVVVTADHETGGIAITGGNLKNHTLEVKFSGGEHTGVMVPVYAFGPSAVNFTGIHENTFFFGEFLRLLKITE